MKKDTNREHHPSAIRAALATLGAAKRRIEPSAHGWMITAAVVGTALLASGCRHWFPAWGPPAPPRMPPRAEVG